MSLSIISIIDKHLDKMISQELNFIPSGVATEMKGQDKPDAEGWEKWFPVKSNITDEQLKELELKLEHPLPGSYKLFLKHKHFYELMIAEVNFCRHSSDNWQKDFLNKVFNGYPREFLFEKGYIPFADYSDWGLLCFSTSGKEADEEAYNNDYPIFCWDHERPDHFKWMYNNFQEMVIELDREDKVLL